MTEGDDELTTLLRDCLLARAPSNTDEDEDAHDSHKSDAEPLDVLYLDTHRDAEQKAEGTEPYKQSSKVPLTNFCVRDCAENDQ